MDTSPVSSLPTTFTIGERTYELVPFLKEGESSVKGEMMVARAKKLKANLGKKEGQFILKHQDEIPSEYRGKIYLVFPDWRDPSDPRGVVCLGWGDGRWYLRWHWFDCWLGGGRLVRRVK